MGFLKNSPLSQQMLYHTIHPKAVREVALEFLETRLRNQPFIAMHFKNTIPELSLKCKTYYNFMKPGMKMDKMCKNILENSDKITDTSRSEIIEQWVRKVKGHYFTDKKMAILAEKIQKNQLADLNLQDVNLEYVYIATPLTVKNRDQQRKFINQLREKLLKPGYLRPRTGLVYSIIDLEKFILDKFVKCPKTKLFNQIYEFISQVEQQICKKSEIFAYTGSSAFSKTVNFERKVEFRSIKYDIDVEEFLKEDYG